jgi:hypothetical protein
MLIYSPLSAYFDDAIPQQPALSTNGKQRQPALGDFTSPILLHYFFLNYRTINIEIDIFSPNHRIINRIVKLPI